MNRHFLPLFVTLLLIATQPACNPDDDVQGDVGIAEQDGGDAYQGFADTGDDDTSDGDADSGDGDAGAGDSGDEDAGDGESEVDPLACPPLPETSGNTEVVVSPDDISELPHMIRTAEENTTFLLEDGTYNLTQTLHIRADGLQLRSLSNDPERVILDGRYEVNSLLLVNSSDVTVAHITLTRAVHHPIHISPGGDDPTDLTGSHIYDVRIIDASQQFIKVNPNGARTAFVDDGRLECSYFELTDEGRPHVDRSATGCYTGGIDAHGARGWVIRNNEFRDIYCAGEGLAEHAVHFWTGSRDTVVEKNLIVNCARGIGFGLRESGDARTYDDDPYPEVDGLIGHYDGLIRNNIIYADHQWYDTGIELAQSRGVRAHHNTIYTPEASGSFSSIDYRFENTVAEIRNNLTDRISRRNDAEGTVEYNLESIGPDLFVDAANLDFRLLETATDAIDQGVEVDDAGLDFTGQARPRGDAPDIGAHEYQ